MKLAEMNERQKKAFHNIRCAANWIIGGYENALADFDEDSNEYQTAKDALADHDMLVEDVYNAAITDIYGDGSCTFGMQAERYLRDIRFCGKPFLMERCEARVRKLGY